MVQPGVDAIVHLAAATSVLRSVDRPAETFTNNVTVTADALGAGPPLRCRHLRLRLDQRGGRDRRGIFPIDERTPLAPLTPYGATKAAAEMLLSAYTAVYGVRSACAAPHQRVRAGDGPQGQRGARGC